MLSLAGSRAKETHPPNGSSLQYDSLQVDTRYLKNNEEDKPAEDTIPVALSVGDYLVIAVADGVTRSRDSEGQYPDPSPARRAADAALSTAVQYVITGLKQGEPSEQLLFESVRRGNEAVGEVNRELGFTGDRVDYGKKDFAGTTLTIGVLARDGSSYKLYWGHIADSCLLTISPDGSVRRITSIQTRDENRLKEQMKEEKGVGFDDKEWLRWYRRKVRNNKEATAEIDGRMVPIGFGVLTGESGAEGFIETGVEPISSDCSLMLITDGAVVLGHPRIGDIVRSSLSAEILSKIFQEALELQTRRDLPSDDMSGISVRNSTLRVF